MNEEKLISYRLEKERKEKILRKEAYMLHLQEEEKQKKAHKEEIIDKLVSWYILLEIKWNINIHLECGYPNCNEQTHSNLSAEEIIKSSVTKKSESILKPFDIRGITSILDEFEDTSLMLSDSGQDMNFDPMDHMYEDPNLYTLHEHYHDPLSHYFFYCA